ncbi:transposase [Methylorubrum thiocyanatum]|uniref:transposase n=1 Tax=Methylorubrum thiocyanatum TaxID=47958 RepID=UPI00383A9965
MLDPLHAALATQDLLPAGHLVDAAHINADGLVAAARDQDVALTGSVQKDNQWQARNEGAFAIEALHLDLERQIATCPAGHDSRSWHPNDNLGRTVMRIRFAAQYCRACSPRPRCTRSQRRLLPRTRVRTMMRSSRRGRETSSAFNRPAPSRRHRAFRALRARRARRDVDDDRVADGLDLHDAERSENEGKKASGQGALREQISWNKQLPTRCRPRRTKCG